MLIRADLQTNMMKLTGAFCDYLNTTKNSLFYLRVNTVLFENCRMYQYASVAW
jgi:hypothetical protein